MKIPTPQSWELSSRFVGSVVVAAGGDQAMARGVEQSLANSSVLWKNTAALGATAGVDELRAALPATGLDPVIRARVDTVLELIGNGDAGVTPAVAGRALGLTDISPTGVRAALRRRQFDIGIVAPADGSAPRRPRVPASFLESRSLKALTSLVSPAEAAAKPAVVASGTGSSLVARGASLLRGARAATSTGVQALASQAAQHPTSAALIGVASVGASGLGVWHLLAGGETNGKGTSLDGARNVLRSSATPGLGGATNAADTKRLAIAQAALAQIGIRDIAPDGSLTADVKKFKSSVSGGRPGDANARWESAFASWIVAAKGHIKIGADGSGSSDVTHLSYWAQATGRFRAADDHKGGLKTGNLVFIERREPSGDTWHDIGVLAGPAKRGDGWVVVSAGRLDGTTAKVNGSAEYVGKVGWEVIHPGDSLKKTGHQIEGFLDPVATPGARSATARKLLSLPGGAIKAMDISNHQGKVDWAAIKGDGIQTAYLKSSEGKHFVDGTYAGNRAGAAAQGIPTGAYDFARPGNVIPGDVVADAKAEAEHFLSTAGITKDDLAPALDLENAGSLNQAQLAQWVKTWGETVKDATGSTPALYVSPSFWNAKVGANADAAKGYKLWVADWGVSNPSVLTGWHSWAGWQTSSHGAVAGITGRVDIDVVQNPSALLVGP